MDNAGRTRPEHHDQQGCDPLQIWDRLPTLPSPGDLVTRRNKRCRDVECRVVRLPRETP